MKIALLFISAFILGVNCFPAERQTGPRCNSFCPMYVIEFCGSDGKTYHSNECFIKSQRCHQGLLGYESFTSLHYGACTGDELKATVTTAQTSSYPDILIE